MAVCAISLRTATVGRSLSTLDIPIRATSVSIVSICTKPRPYFVGNFQLYLTEVIQELSSTNLTSTKQGDCVMNDSSAACGRLTGWNRFSWISMQLLRPLWTRNSLSCHSQMGFYMKRPPGVMWCNKFPHLPLHTTRHYHSSTRMQAGHNKWSKVKHKKKATDLEKSRTIHRFVNLIMSAVKTGGGVDPDANVHLASAMETARKAGVSS